MLISSLCCLAFATDVPGPVFAIVRDGTSRAVRLDESGWTPVDLALAGELAAGNDGTVWALGREGVVQLHPPTGHTVPYPASSFEPRYLAVTDDGALCVAGTFTHARWDGATWAVTQAPEASIRDLTAVGDACAWSLDSAVELWGPTTGRVRHDLPEAFSGGRLDALDGRPVSLDMEGLQSFDGERWTVRRPQQGPPDLKGWDTNGRWGAFREGDGFHWVVRVEGPEGTTSFRPEDMGRELGEIAVDRRGRVWFVTDEGIHVRTPDGRESRDWGAPGGVSGPIEQIVVSGRGPDALPASEQPILVEVAVRLLRDDRSESGRLTQLCTLFPGDVLTGCTPRSRTDGDGVAYHLRVPAVPKVLVVQGIAGPVDRQVFEIPCCEASRPGEIGFEIELAAETSTTASR